MSSVPPYDRRTEAGWRDPAPAPAAPGSSGWGQPPAADPTYPDPNYAAPGYAGPGPAAPAAPGYGAPGYADPAYQPTTAWGPGDRGVAPAPEYRPPRARRTGPSFASVAPALFASVLISIGVLVLFLGNLFVALGAPRGTAGRDRLLQFLSPGDLATAAALVLAVALVVLQRQLPAGAGAPIVGPRGGRVRSIALLAGGVAAFLACAALVRGIVFLTVPHTPGAVKLGDFIGELAAVIVAGAAAWWAFRQRW
jgi:hypothetical protein